MKRNYHQKDVKSDRKARLSSKSLRAMLIYKFLHEYGFNNGIVTAKAIVEDIVKLVEGHYQDSSHLKIGEMLWVAAVKGQAQFYGKNIHNTEKKVVKLTIFDEEDIQELSEAREINYQNLRISRAVRWLKEANQQGAALTLEELSAISLVSISALSTKLKGYQNQTKSSLPLRGYLEDIGRGTTHKKQIINLHLQNYLSSDIARMTSHSKDAVDRYINDYQIITMLSRKFDRQIIPVLARKSKTLVEEYLKMCQNYQEENKLASVSVGVK